MNKALKALMGITYLVALGGCLIPLSIIFWSLALGVLQ